MTKRRNILLPGLDGRKMSKSFGNDISVTASAEEQFARLMAIADESIEPYRRLVLLEPARAIAVGQNPMADKLELAERVVARLNGADAARSARDEWERRFSRREAPSDIPTFACAGATDICRLLRDAGLTASSSEARRLVSEGAVFADERRISDPEYRIDPESLGSGGIAIRVGRRRYVRAVR